MGANTFSRPGIKPPGEKVLVSLSGRVGRGDSFLVAALLKSQGHWVTAYHLRYLKEGQPKPAWPKMDCMNEIPVDEVKKLCDHLEIPLITESIDEVFTDTVVDRMVHEVLQNRILRPCVWCNDQIRIPRLMKKADALGIEKVATGHHAQVINDVTRGKVTLKRSMNPAIDQSMDLFRLKPEDLKRMIMPLGAISASMLHRLAQELGISKWMGDASVKKEIQGMGAPHAECFIGDPSYIDFVDKRSAATFRVPGVIRALDGSVVGEHQGMYKYRVGDPLPGVTLVTGQAYVIGHDPQLNAVLAGPQDALKTTEVKVRDVHCVVPVDGIRPLKCQILAKHLGVPRPGQVVFFENGGARVYLQDPQMDLVPGRPIVFYDNDEVIGGGFIEQ